MDKNKIENLDKIKLTANILFSGIGCQERGIENTGLFDLEVINTSEINQHAVLAYAAIHCGLTQELIDTYNDYPSAEEMAQQLTDINLGYESEKDKKYDWFKIAKRKNHNDIRKFWLANKLAKNLGDISKIDSLKYADFWTISSPCTDISVAGKLKGMDPDSGTRSSLLWENIRLLKIAKQNNELPKYIFFENVKNIVGKKFIDGFNDFIDLMNDIGFNCYYEVLNAKNCGIPQNRERLFLIGIRKDIDTGKFTFPEPFDNGVRLKDVLDDKVDEKYYINTENSKRLIEKLIKDDSLFNNTEERERERVGLRS